MTSILITGVSSGIGRACVERFAGAGWGVTGTLRPGAPGLGLRDDGVRFRPLDLSEPASVRALVDEVLAEDGAPDVLLNNAGALQFGSVEDTTPEAMRALFEVNVLAHIDLTRAFLPAMRERGSGLIANVTSLGGRLVFPFFATYNASKWAMEGYSEGLWHELKPFGIRVKTIEPGYVETAIWAKAMKDGDRVRMGSEAYRPYQEAMAGFERAITKRTSPEEAAEEVWRVVNDPSDRLRNPIAAYARVTLAARRLFGDMVLMRTMHSRWMRD